MQQCMFKNMKTVKWLSEGTKLLLKLGLIVGYFCYLLKPISG